MNTLSVFRTLTGCLAGCAVFVVTSSAEAAAAKRLNFVACPIVRDTEEVPCWLTEYKGELYYLGIQLDLQSEFFPPQLSHKALVEGVVAADKPRICGGIVLDPVKVSTMPDVDISCEEMLPAEGYKIDFARRGTGPDPARLSAVNQAKARQFTPPAPPFTAQTFTVYFDFDSDFMPTRANKNITAAMRYANAIKASRIEIRGYRGSALLTDGQKLAEYDYLAERRTKAIHSAIVDIGAPANIVTSSWNKNPEPANGVDDYETRRVTITVTP
jgi:outer membrane protein OmpA-like peptidoglycan-associated protein